MQQLNPVQRGQHARGPLMSYTGREHQYDSQATQPFFNNQNTIVMVARSHRGYLMLMHETRVFFFEYVGVRDENDEAHGASMAIDNVMADDVNYADAAQHFINLVLSMLTVRKYRLLTSFYLLWTILNQIMLVMLFGLLFYSGETKKFMDVINDNIWIFVVLGIEIMYDVLEYTVKIWILNRVSVWIVGFICFLYGVAFAKYGILWDNAEVLVLFSLRLISIFFSFVVDYCIDLELETDLREGTLHSIDLPFCCKTDREERLAFPYCGGGHNEIELAEGWQFRGTKCAWTGENVFKSTFQRGSGGDADSFKCYRIVFHLLFFITYIPVGLTMGVMTILACLVQCLIKMCFCCCREKDGSETILHELLSRESY